MSHIIPGRRTIAVFLLLILIPPFLQSCARSPLMDRATALRPAGGQEIQDDLNLDNLAAAIDRALKTLESSTQETVQFGSRSVPLSSYKASLSKILDLLNSGAAPENIYSALAENFELYEVYGDKDWSEALITSYFEPVIEGSLVQTEKFSQPLYKLPPELLKLDLTEFDPKWKDERKLRARITDNKLRPYYSREEIDSKGALKGRGLEICWVEPVDAFFLHIQGSGTVILPDGKELRLNFAEKNGQPYKALGQFLTDAIPLSEMNLTNMQRYLRSLPPAEMQRYLNMNPSYIFFTPSQINAVTSSGAPATPSRTIATDGRYFPKGTLVLLEFDKPVKFINQEGQITYDKTTVRRLVLDQDVGGAITGGGRVDLFWGKGVEAGDLAGRVKSRGRVWYLVPR